MGQRHAADRRGESGDSSSRVAGLSCRRLKLALCGLVLSAVGGSVVGGVASATESVTEVMHRMPLVEGTPCTPTAKACVDLDAQRAWLLENGTVVRGPIRISSGGAGKETPVGHSLRVYRKEKDYESQESRLPNGDPSPMPWAVFFQDGGIAFHGGDTRRASSGCIRVPPGDAKAFFGYLQIGDQVQVVRGKEERAARSDVAVASLDGQPEAAGSGLTNARIDRKESAQHDDQGARDN